MNKVGLGFVAQWFGLEKEEGGVAVRNPAAAFMNNKEAGEIFVVNGEAVNNFAKPRASIQVKVSLYGPKGEILQQKTAYCGNSLSKEQLMTLPVAELEKVDETILLAIPCPTWRCNRGRLYLLSLSLRVFRRSRGFRNRGDRLDYSQQVGLERDSNKKRPACSRPFLLPGAEQLCVDGTHRTGIYTSTAIDAGIRIDRALVTRFADCVDRTGFVTCAAVDAFFGNRMSQGGHLLLFFLDFSKQMLS